MTFASATGRPLRLGALIAAALLAAGCSVTPTAHNTESTSQTTHKGEQPGRLGIVTVTRGVRIVHDDWASLGYRWQWSTTPLIAGNGKVDLVDILGDTIAVQSEDSYTSLLQASTGNRRWQVRNTSPLTRFVANTRVNDVLLSCSRPELFLMELNSGNLIARQPVELVVSTRPVIYGGLAVFGTPVGQILCHRFGKINGDPLPPPFDDGAKEWAYALDGTIEADPVRMGATAGFVTQAGEVFFVDIPSGKGISWARISGGMATDPVTDGERMYVASLDQSIYAFRPGDSTWIWRYRTDAPITQQPFWADGVLYCQIRSEGLVAFDVGDNALDSGAFGHPLWKNPDVTGVVVTTRNDDLVVWDGSNATLIDHATGDVIAAFKLPGISRLIPGPDEDLYALADNGLLIKFSPR